MKREVEDICKEETQALPGTQDYIAGYQRALAQVVDGLDETEVAEFQRLAEEWTKKSPPVEFQRK